MNTSRRDFLKRVSAVGAAGAAGMVGTNAAQGSAGNAEPQDGLGMLTDLTLCVGCRKCEFACNEANGLPNEPIGAYEDTSVFEQKRRTDANHLTVVNRYPAASSDKNPTYIKTQCMHCNEPACASACLVGAIRKTAEGPVIYDSSVCIGCRYCMIACPFSMPAYTYDEPLKPVVRKCTMCFERISKSGVPACAKICPVEAITFGRRSQLLGLAREKINRHPDKYINHIYGEHEVGGTGWLYLSPKPFQEVGFKTDLGTTAYPELTRGFLSLVPLVVTIWPAVLFGAHILTRHREQLAHADAMANVVEHQRGA